MSLLSEKQEEFFKSEILKKAFTYFKYGKFEEEYLTKNYLLDQIVKKTLYIAEALYSDYALLFLFDNATNHLIYAQDVFQVTHINKGLGS